MKSKKITKALVLTIFIWATLTLAWCWSKVQTDTNLTTKKVTHTKTVTTNAISANTQKIVKNLEKKYKIPLTKAKDWNILPDYEKVRKDYKKELGNNYSYFSV